MKKKKQTKKQCVKALHLIIVIQEEIPSDHESDIEEQCPDAEDTTDNTDNGVAEGLAEYADDFEEYDSSEVRHISSAWRKKSITPKFPKITFFLHNLILNNDIHIMSKFHNLILVKKVFLAQNAKRVKYHYILTWCNNSI